MVLYGRWESSYVDGHKAQQHLRQLVAAGMPLRHIAARLGTSDCVVQRIHAHPGGDGFVISRRHATNLLALSIDSVHLGYRDAPDDAVVNGVGSRRRLQALVAAGWPQTDLAQRCNWAYNHLNWFLNQEHAGLTAAAARRIAAVFNDLQLQQGPSRRAQRLAERRGWQPALAWEEDSIDDPDAVPHTSSPERQDDDLVDEIVIERCLAAWRNNTPPPAVAPTDRAAVAEALLSAGATRKYICEVIGWSRQTLVKRLAA
ncbi:hypothetical protein [Dietzia sp. 179-F 9C3 NHS]|uniref:hypothetical protein n=1 Tax=Dietzia sp. 179-F 9C3 NHS TaxID=3374295 RepID=UPI00387A120F